MQKTAYEMRISDWSSDVCSSDLGSDAVGTEHFDIGPPIAFLLLSCVGRVPLHAPEVRTDLLDCRLRDLKTVHDPVVNAVEDVRREDPGFDQQLEVQVNLKSPEGNGIFFVCVESRHIVQRSLTEKNRDKDRKRVVQGNNMSIQKNHDGQ